MIMQEQENRVITLPQDAAQATRKTVIGDRFALCRFHLVHGTIVEDTDNNLGSLLSRTPDYIDSGNDEVLSVCEIGGWKVSKHDPSDLIPVSVRTIYEIHHYDDPYEEQ